jgi:protein-S-isoprenylcysteine O-methyltransferase Ste14
MPAYAYCILAAGTILWCVPFAFARVKQKDSSHLDKRARWGVALECLSYTLLWQGHFWDRYPEWWRLALSVLLFAIACALSWMGARAVGRHLRIDAAVNSTHQLVRAGPYRLVRHPIYTSMLCVLLATGVLIAPLFLFLPAVLTFLIGTEIRMRVEDGMLAARFGEQFTAYRNNVPRLIPFLK